VILEHDIRLTGTAFTNLAMVAAHWPLSSCMHELLDFSILRSEDDHSKQWFEQILPWTVSIIRMRESVEDRV
jgi:hypothetical protein